MNDYEFRVKERLDEFNRYRAKRALVQAARGGDAPRRKVVGWQALTRLTSAVLAALR